MSTRGRDLAPMDLLRLYGKSARKRFGQNFLVQSDILERIVDLGHIQPGSKVVEIGPGPGALTSTILRRDVQLTAIEIDRDLAAHLREVFGDDPGFQLIEQDAQTVDFQPLFEGGETTVIANLPYNVATPLSLQMLDEIPPPKRLVLMFQKEVAERICAPVGSRLSGWLTVAIAIRYRARVGLRLRPGAFIPPPKIDSAVVVFEPHATPFCSREDEQTVRALANIGFSMRRKTLRNNLKGYLSPEDWERAQVDPGKRAEALTLAEWIQLAQSLAPEITQKLWEGSR